MLKKKISKHRVILLAILVFTTSFAVSPIMFARALVEEEVLTNPIPAGCQMIDFEEGVEGHPILSTIEGLQFTHTGGANWIYGDVRAGYNAYSLTTGAGAGAYCLNGYYFAWLGELVGSGRIDFTLGTASYFSVLTSTYSGLQIDAYDSDGIFLDTSGRADRNVPWDNPPYYFTRLTVQAEGMAHVIIHDTGNQWLIDDLVTDAPGVGAISATIDFDPDTLNPKSEGKFVTVYIELPDEGEYDLNYIDISTIELTSGLGSVSAEITPTELIDLDEDDIPDLLMVKFDRQGVIDILTPGEEIEITVSGEYSPPENGEEFYGTIDIRVLDFY